MGILLTGSQMTINERLTSMEDECDEDEVIGALRGERLPEHLGWDLLKISVISGILHHPSFAQGEASVLSGLPDYPQFTRALNARSIMSNRIPEMDPSSHPEEIPYCIWHPDVASEETYRQLAKQYPELRYHVARSCAVAGYTNLYLELEDVLPEVSVAEEARDASSTEIFDHILEQPVQYQVMDDCFRTVNLDQPQPNPLNGNTFVSSMFKREKQRFRGAFKDECKFYLFGPTGFKNKYFNLLEDEGIAEQEPEYPDGTHSDMMTLDLLTSPLPTHLPTVHKDLLLLMAAYHGNIDRYQRLRRSRPIEAEVFFVVRGIYHNPLFALWWDRQRNPPEGEPFHIPGWHHIKKAIMARRIMNNDLSSMSNVDPEATTSEYSELPYLIWFPDRASYKTYMALARKVPAMWESCVRAAIYVRHTGLFDDLLLMPGTPTPYLAIEAEASGNQHFISELQRRADRMGISIARSEASTPWKRTLAHQPPLKLNFLTNCVRPYPVGHDFGYEWCLYNGIDVRVDDLELHLMAPESWRVEDQYVELDYEEWPENWSEHVQ